jgi:hypothetical protein
MTRFSPCAWPILLTLAALPSAAFAESFACYPIQRGDTASRLAQRITGDASNPYRLWFDIVDIAGRSVPKSQYDRLRAGWRACVLEKTVEDRRREGDPVVITQTSARQTQTAARQVEPAVIPRSATAPRIIDDVFRPDWVALRTSLNVDPIHIWLGTAVFIPALGFLILGGYVRRRNTATIFMRQFAHLFVREFERPLLQHASDPAMRAQLRISPYRARLEICLAPGSGRRYPNLSDHRKNVEYDVNRVLSAIADDSFVCGKLCMRQEWVVVPFHFNARLKKQGVRCISSL